VIVRLNRSLPPRSSMAIVSQRFPTKPCGHMVSDTKSTATGSGYADALRALADADAATRKPRFMFEADDGEGGEREQREVGGGCARASEFLSGFRCT
jgi:hypothetical protein